MSVPTPPAASASTSGDTSKPHFHRSIGLAAATSMNMTQMCGIGPFLTIPLILLKMNGPQALIGWVLGAILAMADGLVWAELGAAMPGAGGSYLYLREAFQYTTGKLMPFLFVWTAMIGLPLMMSTGVIGLVQYLGYFNPPAQVSTSQPATEEAVKAAVAPAITTIQAVSTTPAATTEAPATAPEPTFFEKYLPAPPQIGVTFTQGAIAFGIVIVTVFALYRNIETIGKLATVLWVIMLISIVAVIVACFWDFHPGYLQIKLDPGQSVFTGLGAVLVFALYDYAGYSTSAYMGGEIKNPGRVLPRSIIYSIIGIMGLYLLLQVGVLGSLPLDKITSSSWIASDVLEHSWGRPVSMFFTGLIVITAFASVFMGLMGASRIPYNAAKDKLFLPVFAKLHPRLNFPHIALIVMGVFTALGSLFSLGDVIDMLTAVMVLLQSIAQVLALTILRKRQPGLKRPYRVTFYPLPNIIALAGWIYIYYSCSTKAIVLSIVWVVFGVIAYLLWAKVEKIWPFGPNVIREEFLEAQQKLGDAAAILE